MDKYCERQGISNPQNVRFLFDGERVQETNTPDEVVDLTSLIFVAADAKR